MGIAENLQQVRENIAHAARKAGRQAADITLVAVSKTVEASRVMEAYHAGQRVFGENRVQEMVEKIEKMPSDTQFHLIGRLQTNKVKYIINRVYLLHSLDRLSLARELEDRLTAAGAVMDVLLQVNASGEESKAGFSAEELMAAAGQISAMQALRVRGLMTIAPFTSDEAVLRGVFSATRALYDRVKREGLPGFDMQYLSMGMSGDYAIAIEEGANMVRVGSAIFGMRQYK